MPMSVKPMRDGKKLMLFLLVQPTMKNPTGKQTAPIIIGGKLSGISRLSRERSEC